MKTATASLTHTTPGTRPGAGAEPDTLPGSGPGFMTGNTATRNLTHPRSGPELPEHSRTHLPAGFANLKPNPLPAQALILLFLLLTLPLGAQTAAGEPGSAQPGGTRTEGTLPTSVSPATNPASTSAEARQILIRMESNQVYRSIEYTGRMDIISGGKTRTKIMRTWSAGSDKAFIEFENPEDRGVRMLKLGKNLWMYFPKERDTVKISGHLLKQGMMGSDVSYEDAMEPGSVLDSYDATITGLEEVSGRPCHVLELTGKTQDLAYPRRTMWIDTERLITMRTRLYARSGKLLKEISTLNARKIKERWFPVTVEMADKLKKDSKTVFTMTSLVLDPPIDEGRFTMAALTR